jgi:hypothetical protein
LVPKVRHFSTRAFIQIHVERVDVNEALLLVYEA